MRLAGLPIAITGASSGIGLATAFLCARAGMPVVLAARREERLADAAAEINSAGGRAIAVRVDVTDPEDCRKLAARTVEAFGSIYAVFANAGYGLEKPALATSDAELRAIFETNFFGTVNTVRPAAERMAAAGRGHVLICSSSVGLIAPALLSAYCASKAAQHLYGRALGLELAASGVHVSTVHPIGTLTEFAERSTLLSGGDGGGRTPRALRQSAEAVGRAVVRCLRRPRAEVWTSVPARALIALGVAWPGLADAILRRRG